MCSLGPQGEAAAKKSNWDRMDCLAAHQLKVERDPIKLKAWFKTQDAEWQTSRGLRFNNRLNDRLRMY